MGLIYDHNGELTGYISSYEEKCFAASIPNEEYYKLWCDKIEQQHLETASTVTGVINDVQNYNGIKFDTSLVGKLELKDEFTLKPEDRRIVDMAVVGLTIDYITRLTLNKNSDTRSVFHTAIDGVHKFCDTYYPCDMEARAKLMSRLSNYLNIIEDIEAFSIECAYNLARFDVCHRNMPKDFNPNEVMLPADMLINMKIMINRAVKFIDSIGPVIGYGVGLSSNDRFDVKYAEVDYITKDCLIDLKVLSSKKIDTRHIAQLLAYYILGSETRRAEFKHITKIMIYNPRYNTAHILKLEDVSEELMQSVKDNILNYKKNKKA